MAFLDGRAVQKGRCGQQGCVVGGEAGATTCKAIRATDSLVHVLKE